MCIRDSNYYASIAVLFLYKYHRGTKVASTYVLLYRSILRSTTRTRNNSSSTIMYTRKRLQQCYVYAYHTPLGRISKLDRSTTKRVPVPIPNDTSSESSRRDVSKCRPFLAPTLFQLRRYRPMETGPGVCDIHHRMRYIMFNPPAIS